MKTIIKFLFVFVVALSFTSCEDDVDKQYRITYYAEITLVDGAVSLPVGGTYTEPGFAADENGVDVTSDVVVTDNIDPTTIGVYTVTYSVENSDGYLSTVERTVVVAVPNPGGPESGVYYTDIVRTEGDGTNPRPRGTYTISFVHQGSNIYEVECMLGGYYSTGSGYGPNYSIGGEIEFDPVTNEFIYIDSYCPGWDDSLAGFQNASWDSSTGGMYWESIYAGGDIFAVTLTK